MPGNRPPKRKALAPALAVQGPAAAQAMPETPFSPEVQAHVFRLLLEDTFLGEAVASAVGSDFFTVDPLKWAWYQALLHRQQYKRFPSMLVLRDLASRLPQAYALPFLSYLEWVRTLPRVDVEWLRKQTIDFVGRVVFRKAIVDSRDLFNMGKWGEAYDLMQTRMRVIDQATYARSDRGWLADDFASRVARRMDGHAQGELIGTGFPELDKAFGGGARPGFVGLWLGRAKKGKTTLLINLMANAMRIYAKKCVYFTLEGGRELIEERFDAIFMGELLSLVRSGNVDAQKYAAAAKEMQHLRGLGVVESIGGFRTTILDIERRLNELEHAFDFVPEFSILDYVDILHPIEEMGSVTYNQIAACQQWKVLCEQRGLVGHTASQGTRPSEDHDDITPTLLTSRDIADAYGKVRIVDAWGSVNQTKQEREQNIARMFLEGNRQGPGELSFYIRANFSTMTMGPMEDAQVPQPIKQAALATGKKAKALLAPAYKQGSL